MEDLDYLFSTARIRTMEGKLLNRQKLEELINTEKPEDAIHRLEECGWEDPDFSDHEAMDRSLSQERRRVYKEIEAFAPDKSMVRVFRLKYDYHNLKVLLKAGALGRGPEGMLSECGSVPAAKMEAAVAEDNYSALSPAMRNAAVEASEILNRTGDPQFSDIALDRACFAEMLQLAKASGSEFLTGYVRLCIDSVNLNTAVRLKKRGLPYEYMRQAAIAGGSVDSSRLVTELTPDAVETVFAKSALLPAAQVAAEVLRGSERLSALDMASDNAVMGYLHNAKYVGLGEQPLVAYIAAKEAELVALRIVFGGKLSGLDPKDIKERLRDTYV